jgi:hypothetical protein
MTCNAVEHTGRQLVAAGEEAERHRELDPSGVLERTCRLGGASFVVWHNRSGGS